MLSIESVKDSVPEDVGSHRIVIANQNFYSASDLAKFRRLQIVAQRALIEGLEGSTSWTIYCDHCDKAMLYDMEFYHCRHCSNDDFDVCLDCMKRGHGCSETSHTMEKRVLRQGEVIGFDQSSELVRRQTSSVSNCG